MGVQLESTGCWPMSLGTSLVKALTNNRITDLFRVSKPGENQFNKLPFEICWIILSYCSEKDLLTIRQVSKFWLLITQDPVFYESSYKSPVHPISWAMMTQSCLKIKNTEKVSLEYKSKGPNGSGRLSRLVFIKAAEGKITVEDSQATVRREELKGRYYLSPFWIFHPGWESPDLKDKMGQYFVNLVKGERCPMKHIVTKTFGPEEFFIQSINQITG